MRNTLHDTLGFAGIEIIRRIVGIADVSDIRDFQNDQGRARLEKLALYLGQRLILERESFVSIAHLNVLLQDAATYYHEHICSQKVMTTR